MNLTVLEQQLATLGRDLEAAQDELSRLDEEAQRAEHAHDIAFARALLSAKGSNAETRKAEATLVTEDSALTARIAAVKVRAAKGKVSALSTRVDIGRSLLSASKATWATAGAGAA